MHMFYLSVCGHRPLIVNITHVNPTVVARACGIWNAILSLTTHVTIGLLINKRLRIPKGQSKNGQSREITT
jgi:hypothetical protein